MGISPRKCLKILTFVKVEFKLPDRMDNNRKAPPRLHSKVHFRRGPQANDRNTDSKVVAFECTELDCKMKERSGHCYTE